MANSTTKRLQVYVSSTYLDLMDEYQAVIETILTLGHQPAGMGIYSIELPSSMTLIEQWIETSDVLVLLLGNQYGELDPNSGKSSMQLEYEFAIANNIPIITLAIDGETPPERIEEHSLDSIDLDQCEQLERFRQIIQANPIDLWRHISDIEQVLTERLPTIAAQDTVLGWVRPQFTGIEPSPQSTVTLATIPAPDPAATMNPEDVTVTLQTVQSLATSWQTLSEMLTTANQVNQRVTATLQASEDATDITVSNVLRLQETLADGARTSKRLAEVSQQMTKIVQLMNQVASRTNVIALNTSIEVNRLGSRSTGFTKIAEEMRQLATHTAKVSQAVEKITNPLQTKVNAVLSTLGQGIQQSLVGAQQAQQTQQSLANLGQVAIEIDQIWGALAAAMAEQDEVSEQITSLLRLLEADETPPTIQQVTDSLRNLVALSTRECRHQTVSVVSS